MQVNLSKILAAKIYLSSLLHCDPSDEAQRYFALAYDPASNDGFDHILKGMKFTPAGKEYVYYPAQVVNPTSFAPLAAVKDRTEFYSYMEKGVSAPGTRVKLLNLDPAQFEKQDSHSPVFMTLAAYFKHLDPYAQEHKVSAANKYAYYKMALAKILPKYTSAIGAKGRLNLIVNITGTKTPNSLLFFILYGLQRDFEGMSTLLKSVNVIFMDGGRGLFMSPDLKDKKRANSTRNLIGKFIKLSDKFEADAATKDTDVSTDDGTHAADAVMASYEVDRTAESAKNEHQQTDSQDISSVAATTDLDLDEIISTDVSSEFERVRKENSEFLEKFKDTQNKALDAAQKEATGLYTNTDLVIKEANDPTVINPKMKTAVISAITSSYYDKVYKHDIINFFKALNNDPDHPVVITGLSMRENSDPLNMKHEISAQMLDKRGKRHNFTVDVPKISHDGFLYLNGNKKFITKQALLLPIIKEATDRVQITTNYKKTFLYRRSDKTSGLQDRLLKTLIGTKIAGVKQTSGNSFSTNLKFNVSIPYNFFSKKLFGIEFSMGNEGSMHVVFSQKKIRDDLNKFTTAHHALASAGYVPVAYQLFGGKLKKIYFETPADRPNPRSIVTTDVKGIFLPQSPTTVYKGIIDFLVQFIRTSNNQDLIQKFASANAGKSLGQSQIRLAGQLMTLAALVSFYKGLREMLDMYGIKWTVSDKPVRAGDTQTVLRFKDASLIIDAEGDTAKELLINGLYPLNTKDYSLSDSERRGALYLEYFGEYTGSRNTAKALLNFESSMIDPITLDVLRDLKLPETFVELLLYGNSMLASYEHKRKNDMSNFRIRDSEVISVAVYATLMDSFNEYKRTVKTGVVSSISAPRDAVIKKTQTYQNIEDYSILSPFLEIQTKAKATFKGPSGLNSDDSYTTDIRAYDDSMLGVFGIFTPVSAQVGIARSMALNPRINHVRGYLGKKKLEELGQDNLYAPGELLNIFVASHSDPMRICMSVTQGGHIMPTMKQHNYLIGTGLEKTLPHLTGQDFAWKASENGVITKVDMANKLVFVKYDDGVTTAIDIANKPAKNSASGFYTENQLELLEGLKVGSKFKKGQILATNQNFFKEDMDGSHSFAAGRLTKVALMCLPTTYEDSMPITDTIRREMASDVISEKQIVLKENSRIVQIAKEGQTININEPLVIYEEIGDTEKDALKAIDRAAVPQGGDLEFLGKNVIKSKYAGKITNVKVYYNCKLDSESLEPSLKEYVTDYIGKHQRRSNLLKGIKSDELIEQASTERIDSEKILGNEMQGVLIVFYIMHQEDASIGNKLTFFSACKGIVSEVIPDEKAPHTDYRPEDPIDALISPMSLISRNVPDLMLTGLANRVLVELRMQCLEDLGLR